MTESVDVDDLSALRSDDAVDSDATQRSLFYSILTRSETQHDSIDLAGPGTERGAAAALQP